MNHSAVDRDDHSTGSVDDPFDVAICDFPVLDGDDPVAVDPLDMGPCNSCEYGADVGTRHQ